MHHAGLRNIEFGGLPGPGLFCVKVWSGPGPRTIRGVKPQNPGRAKQDRFGASLGAESTYLAEKSSKFAAVHNYGQISRSYQWSDMSPSLNRNSRK